ncbi:MAG: GNAT family N-acetyltransferase [Candidatus Heimdallarchaeota archaeon]|nr:GNAT family N-acetyltransferase [Candidatus Heimdallarchaeota archaeon]
MYQDLTIIPFESSLASEVLIKKYLDLDDTIDLELNPEEGLMSRDFRKKSLQTPNPHMDVYTWICMNKDGSSGPIIGKAILSVETSQSPNYERNGHIARLSLNVLHDYRRMNIGSILLEEVVKKTNELPSVKLLLVSSNNEMGWQFCENKGAKLALEQTKSVLDFSDVDWVLITDWRNQKEVLAETEHVDFVSFEAVPEEIIEEYASIYTETINQQPLGSLQLRSVISPDTLRNRANLWIGGGMKWHTIISKEKNGEISGLTEFLYNPEQPKIIHQLLTGVKKKYRKRGLGKILKGELLCFMKEEYPEAKFVSTSNTITNEAMVSINTRMGFREKSPLKYYEFTIEKL